MKKINFLHSLQLYRAIAVLFVVFHHIVDAIKQYHTKEFVILNFIGDLGKYGVDYFFILSGFIISYTTLFRINEENGVQKYLKNRIIRIYAPYLPVSIGLLILFAIFSNLSNSNTDVSLFSSLTLLPYGRPALSVAWTLIFEMVFYVFYAIRFYGRRTFRITLFIWIGIIILSNIIFSKSTLNSNGLLSVLTSFYNLEFFLGMLLAYLYSKKIIFNKTMINSIALFFCLFFLYLKWDEDILPYSFSSNFVFSIFVGLIIYSTVFFYKIKLHSKNVLMLIGNASYSIYLTHNNIQTLLIRFFPKIEMGLRVFLMIIVSFIISCFIGYVYSIIFEVKITNYLKKKLIK